MPTIIKSLEKAIEEQSMHVKRLTSSIQLAYTLILGIFLLSGVGMCVVHKMPIVSIDLLLMTVETVLLLIVFYTN